MNAIRAGLAIVLVAAVATAACGEGSRLTRSEFGRDASRICERATRLVARTVVPSLARHRAAARAFERLAERERSALGHLRDLRAPRVESDPVDAWLAVVDQLIDEIDFAIEALRHSDTRTAEAALDRSEALDQRARHLGQRNGVSPCRFAPPAPAT